MTTDPKQSDYSRFLCREYTELWKNLGVDLSETGDFEVAIEISSEQPNSASGNPAPCAPMSLEQVRAQLGQGCGSGLCATRTNLVFGSGNPSAKLMFVGEGPGADEDAQGLPFVGRAGQLLTKIIEAMGLQREHVYIANVVKCRPPNNRVPQPEEIALCLPFLRSQIAAVSPKWIVALGATAASALVQHTGALGQVRGKMQPLGWDPSIRVMPTYHPAYLLRNPPAKKVVWEDMKVLMSGMEQSP